VNAPGGFFTGNNLYYVIGGAAAFVCCVCILCVVGFLVCRGTKEKEININSAAYRPQPADNGAVPSYHPQQSYSQTGTMY